jgi:hypothetical protein
MRAGWRRRNAVPPVAGLAGRRERRAAGPQAGHGGHAGAVLGRRPGGEPVR